jgi:dephospho-CoA kinase
MKVIGAIGLNGSGKDELVEYLHERHGIPMLSMGDIVRDIADEERICPTRSNLHEISRRYIARHGKEYFVKRLIADIEEKQWQSVAITGIRTPADVRTLQAYFGQDFLLVHVRVGDPHIRFERGKERGEARDPQRYKAFLEQDKEEQEIFDIDEAIKQADITIDNDGSLQAFHRKIDRRVVEPMLGDWLGRRKSESDSYATSTTTRQVTRHEMC